MKIDRVVPNLTVPDLTDAIHEHGEALGMRVVMDHGWVATLADDDGHQLTLLTQDATAPVNPDVSGFVDDIHEAHLRVLRSGRQIVHPLTEEPWGVTRFFYRDSAGRVINVGMHSERPGWASVGVELAAALEDTLHSAAQDSQVTPGAAISLSADLLYFPDCVVAVDGWTDDPAPWPVPLHVDVPGVVRDVLTHLPEGLTPRDQLWLALEAWLEMFWIRAGHEVGMRGYRRVDPPTPWFSCLLHAPSVHPEMRFRRGLPGPS